MVPSRRKGTRLIFLDRGAGLGKNGLCRARAQGRGCEAGWIRPPCPTTTFLARDLALVHPCHPRRVATRNISALARVTPRKSSLFSLTPRRAPPPKQMTWRRAQAAAGWQSTSLVAVAVESCLERSHRPVKSRGTKAGSWPHTPAVPETASGLQGEEPLVNGVKVGKGSRQNGSVTSGQGLALGGDLACRGN